MSTKHSDLEKGQEFSPQIPGSLQEERVSPGQTFLPPPKQPPRQRNNRWFVIGTIIVLAALILSLGGILIAGLVQHPGSQVKPTPTAPATTITPTPGGNDTTPAPEPGVVLGPRVGPSAVANPAYWDAIIGTQKGVNKVESVSFANILGNSSLQALITVRSSGSDARLDVYVYNNITSSKPEQIFKLQGLVKGDAKISGYNTIMTAEVDRNSSLNAGKPLSAMTPDLFREFRWSDGAGTLVQTAFPGIFPDLTRYQAEADQAQVKAGHDPWKNDPALVARALASQFFGWQRTITTKLLSGGGPQDVDATVQVQEPPLQGVQSQGPSATVTLSRLEGNTANMWVAIGIKDGTMLTLTNIPDRSLITSPVTLEGTGAAFEAVIGQAIVYDHLYTNIGHAQVTGSNGMGVVSYSTKVSYTSSFKGVQEGIVAVYEANGGISSENYTVVMVKVLISA